MSFSTPYCVVTVAPNKTGMPMTEAAIDPSLFRDLYIALGESLGEGAWSLRLYYKPLIRWIWLGGLLIMLGALLVFKGRYKNQLNHNAEITNIKINHKYIMTLPYI
jgi:cytochrome c-type biogenesis protein CcmF